MDEATGAKSLEDLRADMGAILGLNAPVEEAVLRAAVEDTTYAHHLLVCRREPEFLSHLLDHPPQPPAQPSMAPKSVASLARAATESMLRWAKTGFTTVTDAVLQGRLEACRACPYLLIPPKEQRRLYALAGADVDRPSVCGHCGCIVSVKARRPDDTCPVADPNHSGLNRWGEPLADIR